MTVETGAAVLEREETVQLTQCDACGAAKAAWKIVGASGSFILMCGHHKTLHEAGLSSWAQEIVKLG